MTFMGKVEALIISGGGGSYLRVSVCSDKVEGDIKT